MKQDGMTEYQLKCLSVYKDLFGDNFINHSIWVVTHVDVDYDDDEGTYKERLQKCKDFFESEIFKAFQHNCLGVIPISIPKKRNGR